MNIINWDKIEKRFDAFWEGEFIDRCCISISSPKTNPNGNLHEFRKPKDLNEQWKSIEFRYEEMVHDMNNRYFAGENFPQEGCNLGPGVMASFVGCKYELSERTVWFGTDPPIKQWDNRNKLKLEEDSELWMLVQKFTDTFSQRSEGRYFTAMTDLGGNFDIAASLRGTENLLFDLTDNPEEVRALINEIDNIWFECYGRLQRLINTHMEGTTAWMKLWCRQRWYPLQCDFSAMISPDMFEEFVLPSLERGAKFLDKSIYHMDGQGQLPHIDLLLGIDRLTGIQWVPGAGNKNVTDEKWYPLYKKIQAKGKNLVLCDADPYGIEKLLENISPRGLYISSICKTEEEANELLKMVEERGKKCLDSAD
jgi:5-methyltetrahydrofolate--homocysteine methyltransferase